MAYPPPGSNITGGIPLMQSLSIAYVLDIHVLGTAGEVVDGRNKPGDDGSANPHLPRSRRPRPVMRLR